MAECIITNPVGRVFPIHVDREDMFFKWEIKEYIAREREWIIESKKRINMTSDYWKGILEELDRMEFYFLPED